jgi:hypothetical protein
MIEGPRVLGATVTLVGLADIEKAWIMILTWIMWTSVLLVAVRVTSKEFATEPVHLSCELPTVGGIRMKPEEDVPEGTAKTQEIPAEGEGEEVKVMFPANPFCEVAVIPAVACCPTITVIEGWSDARAKSFTMKLTVAV